MNFRGSGDLLLLVWRVTRSFSLRASLFAAGRVLVVGCGEPCDGCGDSFVSVVVCCAVDF